MIDTFLHISHNVKIGTVILGFLVSFAHCTLQSLMWWQHWNCRVSSELWSMDVQEGWDLQEHATCKFVKDIWSPPSFHDVKMQKISVWLCLQCLPCILKCWHINLVYNCIHEGTSNWPQVLSTYSPCLKLMIECYILYCQKCMCHTVNIYTSNRILLYM